MCQQIESSPLSSGAAPLAVHNTEALGERCVEVKNLTAHICCALPEGWFDACSNLPSHSSAIYRRSCACGQEAGVSSAPSTLGRPSLPQPASSSRLYSAKLPVSDPRSRVPNVRSNRSFRMDLDPGMICPRMHHESDRARIDHFKPEKIFPRQRSDLFTLDRQFI